MKAELDLVWVCGCFLAGHEVGMTCKVVGSVQSQSCTEVFPLESWGVARRRRNRGSGRMCCYVGVDEDDVLLA